MSFSKLFSIKKLNYSRIKGDNDNQNPSISRGLNSKKYKTILVDPVSSGGTNLDRPMQEKVMYYGDNTGNMLFVEAMKEQLNYEKAISFYHIPQESMQNYAMVMPSSNFIIRGNNLPKQLYDFMDNTKGPFTLAGLGAQAHANDTPKKLVSELPPEKLKFFKDVSARAVSIGVRGEFTAACLEEMGIYNYRIIGCPSVYMSLGKEFKFKKKPSAEKSVFTLTTGNKMESKILDLAMEHNDQWIMQMMTEHPEVAFEGKEMSDDAYRSRFPDVRGTKEEITQFMRKNAHIFFSYKEWSNYLKENEFTFSYGSRFHGNMCSLRNGIPALWITHDSRTSELVNTLHLPSIDYTQLNQIKDVEQLVEYCDYDAFNKHYKTLVNNYIAFLNENGLSHKFN